MLRELRPQLIEYVCSQLGHLSVARHQVVNQPADVTHPAGVNDIDPGHRVETCTVKSVNSGLSLRDCQYCGQNDAVVLARTMRAQAGVSMGRQMPWRQEE